MSVKKISNPAIIHCSGSTSLKPNVKNETYYESKDIKVVIRSMVQDRLKTEKELDELIIELEPYLEDEFVLTDSIKDSVLKFVSFVSSRTASQLERIKVNHKDITVTTEVGVQCEMTKFFNEIEDWYGTCDVVSLYKDVFGNVVDAQVFQYVHTFSGRDIGNECVQYLFFIAGTRVNVRGVNELIVANGTTNYMTASSLNVVSESLLGTQIKARVLAIADKMRQSYTTDSCFQTGTHCKRCNKNDSCASYVAYKIEQYESFESENLMSIVASDLSKVKDYELSRLKDYIILMSKQIGIIDDEIKKRFETRPSVGDYTKGKQREVRSWNVPESEIEKLLAKFKVPPKDRVNKKVISVKVAFAIKTLTEEQVDTLKNLTQIKTTETIVRKDSKTAEELFKSVEQSV